MNILHNWQTQPILEAKFGKTVRIKNMLDNKTTTDCRNKRIKEAKIRSFLKSVVVCFVRHLTDHYTKFGKT